MVRVYRDAHGVPHVRAGGVVDLARGQGRAVAADRSWQLEWLRRRATGATAELLGEAGEPWDRFAVRVRLLDTARRALDALSEEARSFVAAYADGVNDALGDAPELRTLGVDAEEWAPWTPLATFHAQQIIFGDIGRQLWRRRVRKVLGEAAWSLLSREGPSPAGSNAWAVGGARTASGLPLIGGDPHRAFESPGVYHQVRLACEDPDDPFDVVGFSFVGVPGVQHFAHAGGVAWAITNAMASYQDLADVDDDYDGPTVLPGIGFRGASTELGDLGFAALLPLLRARSAADVDAAFEHWVEPVNNVVIADTAGTVRYRWAGRVPVRDDTGRWTGWRTDPHRAEMAADGQVVTANERRGPQSAEIGVEFAPPYRARRIAALLAGRAGLTSEDFAEVHRDTHLGGLEALRHLLPDRLRDWDGHMDADSSAAADFAAWRAELVRLLAQQAVFDGLRDPAPDSLFESYFNLSAHLGLALPALASADRPLGIDLVGLARLADRVDTAVPTWGSTHVFDPVHAFDLVPHLEAPPIPAVPLGGDQDCVRCVGSLPGISDAGYRGSVARYVWDLADRTTGGWVVPMGASGLPGDPHHLDQLPLWAEGRLAPIVTDWCQLMEEPGVQSVDEALVQTREDPGLA